MSGIQVEINQRSPQDTPWHWLTGETYPHRELLKRHGARWSRKRQAWYVVGAELPAAIRTLVTSDSPPNHPQADVSPPLLALFGGRIEAKERASNGDLVITGANGICATRTTWIDPNEHPYAVWEFVLPPHERVGHPLGAIQAALKAAHATYSLYTRKWHVEQPDRAAALDALVSDVPFTDKITLPPAMSPELAAMIEAALAEDDVQSLPDEAGPEPPFEEPTPIRIIRPAPLPTDGTPLDAVQMALRDVKAQPLTAPVTTQIAHGRIARIDQAYVGELTGSITGQIHCYGYALHDGICIYLNMGGPRVATEAMRAKLSKGDIVSVVPPDAPTVELTAGEGNTGMYHAYLHTLPEARFASLILVHDWAVTPNYGGKATTFIFRTSDAQATAKLRHHVMQLVNIPVFESWSGYLYDAGQRAMLVRKCRSEGGIDLLNVDLDADSWTRLITSGLEQGVIQLPK